jgi:hypothetical protein
MMIMLMMMMFIILLDCKELIPACQEVDHRQNNCVRRLQQCSCGLMMEFREMEEHLRLNCNDRFFYCPQGRMMMMI